MCVIAYKPNNVRISYETVLDMWIANPDGAGFAVITPEHTLIMKGYMSPPSLFKALQPFQAQEVVIHFRYATHGEKTAPMTHPFVVHPDLKESLKLTNRTSHGVLFHNGVIPHFGTNKLSDTLDFNLRALAPMSFIEDVCDLLEALASKFVVVYRGGYELIGEFEPYEGMQVSNTYFTFMNNHLGYNEDTILAGKICTPIAIKKH